MEHQNPCFLTTSKQNKYLEILFGKSGANIAKYNFKPRGNFYFVFVFLKSPLAATTVAAAKKKGWGVKKEKTNWGKKGGAKKKFIN